MWCSLSWCRRKYCEGMTRQRQWWQTNNLFHLIITEVVFSLIPKRWIMKRSNGCIEMNSQTIAAVVATIRHLKSRTLEAVTYRWCPRPIPNVNAFCLKEPSDRFINFVSFDTGVLAFECVFNSLISDAVYSLRTIVLFFAFLATSISNLIKAA